MPLRALNPPAALPGLRRTSPVAGARAAVRISTARGALGGGGAWKRVDVATLGNLCVDIVLGVPTLPPAPKEERRAYMDRLAASAPDKKYWEAGGNCNLAIAAARLGLRCIALGHVGNEIYGHFLLDVLQEEGIGFVSMNENADAATQYSALYKTLLCWVLVDPFQKHGFCSLMDFSDEPAFSWMRSLSEPAKVAIEESRILFCNGYAFDEFVPDVLVSAVDCAIDSGTVVFFDPGPRGKTLLHGTAEQRRALQLFLGRSDVLLLTSDEVESLTGITNPCRAGQELIRNGTRTKWVIIKMGSKGSILITKSSISCAPSFKVDVVDTVGCGDSFTAAVAFGFIHEMPSITTLALANAVGAATATGCGAGRNVANLHTVLKLLRQSNLNEDDEFWHDLVGEFEATKASLLSSTAINGSSNCFVHTPIQKVVHELLLKFDSTCDKRVLKNSSV